MCAARSVGSAAPDALHFSEEVDSRRTFDTCTRHSGLEFLGSYEFTRLFQTLPFKEKSEGVDVASATENTATALAVFVPPVEGGIEQRFPGRIVGDFVVDENVDHDFGGTPFQREKVLQTPEKCKGSDHRGLDLRAGCDPLDGRGRVNGRPQKSATAALLTFWSASGNAGPALNVPSPLPSRMLISATGGLSNML
jgi:hypothetical protein